MAGKVLLFWKNAQQLLANEVRGSFGAPLWTIKATRPKRHLRVAFSVGKFSLGKRQRNGPVLRPKTVPRPKVGNCGRPAGAPLKIVQAETPSFNDRPKTGPRARRTMDSEKPLWSVAKKE
uniref:Uncharacterized protein n=1 Tax=Trichuris muris TaxID=70415 RepID=A0A5S6R075_TRIMR